MEDNMVKRTGLASLGARIGLAKKGETTTGRRSRSPATENQKAILFRLDSDKWEALKIMAAKERTTLRAILIAAVDSYLAKRG
jgi:hypothetical protein